MAGLLLQAAAWAETMEFPVYYPSSKAPTAEPAKPYLATVMVRNPTSQVLVDIYAVLRLERFGVDRSQVTITRWKGNGWNGMTSGGNPLWQPPSDPLPAPRRTVQFWQYLPPPPLGPGGQRLGPEVWAPSMERGMIYTAKVSDSSPIMLDVEITW
ncbi:MAG: hypothetical protein HY600_06790 [Candidatus Omnitrophica bacterium]|nr:hypothetical protein [Candidatus Omnitrophota bacterium]